MRKKKKARVINAHVRLRQRETNTLHTTKQVYAQIPIRLQAPIERIVDRERKLLKVVVLGFTANGNHLVAHESRGGPSGLDHSIQFWTFDVHGKRASKLVREVPVLRERDGSSMREVKNARAVAVSFAQSPAKRCSFATFNC
jgi:hypothetical protein